MDLHSHLSSKNPTIYESGLKSLFNDVTFAVEDFLTNGI